MAEEIVKMINNFYSNFILRDLLAKITPGLLLMLTIFVCTFGFDFHSLNQISGLLAIFLIMLSWVMGFAIQGIGEFLHLIRYRPKWKDKKKKELLSDKEYENYKYLFEELDKKDKKIQYERFVIIKEACGNNYVAMLLSSVIIFLRIYVYSEPLQNLPETMPNKLLISLFLILTLSLRHMHYSHVNKQYEVIKNTVECAQK